MGELQGVPDTLFVPLAARIRVSRRFPEYFHDQTALSREGSIPGDAALTASEYGRIASVARYRSVDRMTRAFVAERGRCHIINLGAGLETAAFRLADLDAKFYEVDLPEVIAARSTVIPQGPNEVLVGGDVLTLGWASYLDPATPSLFVALGLLQYFPTGRRSSVSSVACTTACPAVSSSSTQPAGLAFGGPTGADA